jgi:hypothetical protein
LGLNCTDCPLTGRSFRLQPRENLHLDIANIIKKKYNTSLYEVFMSCQLVFFPEEKTEIDLLRDDVKTVKESSDKVRKSIFARHSTLVRQLLDLSERLEILERNICCGSTTMKLQS